MLNYIIYFFVFCCLVFFALSLFLIQKNMIVIYEILEVVVNNSCDTFEDDGGTEITDSYYDDERIRREMEFDERINNLRRELHSYGTVAEELHPLVHNIPHDSVNAYVNYPDFEVSE